MKLISKALSSLLVLTGMMSSVAVAAPEGTYVSLGVAPFYETENGSEMDPGLRFLVGYEHKISSWFSLSFEGELTTGKAENNSVTITGSTYTSSEEELKQKTIALGIKPQIYLYKGLNVAIPLGYSHVSSQYKTSDIPNVTFAGDDYAYSYGVELGYDWMNGTFANIGYKRYELESTYFTQAYASIGYKF